LPIFAFPLLAGVGAQDLVDRFSTAAKRRDCLCVAAVGLAVAIAIGGILWFAQANPFRDEEWRVTLGSGIRTWVILGVLLLMISGLRRESFRPALLVALAVLIPIDGLSHAPWQNPGVS